MQGKGMQRNWWLMMVAAGLVVSGSFGPADARDRGAVHSPAQAGHAFHGRAHHGQAERRHADRERRLDRRATDAGVNVNVDVPVTPDAYASGGGSCRSLRMRAEVTGSGYWWGRHQACLDGRDH